MINSFCLLKHANRFSKRKCQHEHLSACVWVVCLWLWVGSLILWGPWGRDSSILFPDWGWYTRLEAGIGFQPFSLWSPPLRKQIETQQTPLLYPQHQLLHNSVLEAYLNTMTTLSACYLIKGCQSRFKEDLSSFIAKTEDKGICGWHMRVCCISFSFFAVSDPFLLLKLLSTTWAPWLNVYTCANCYSFWKYV